jgi:GTP-binding protein
MALPVVAIIGRPNVGKSTLFNRITRTRTSIVDDLPGVTRDRLYREAVWEGKRFLLADTGGIHTGQTDELLRQTREQALFAVEEADIVILLFDGKDGLTPLDREIVEIIRKSPKKVFPVVNKIDEKKHEARQSDFYSLGLDPLYPVSAITGYGYTELMDAIGELLPSPEDEDAEKEGLPGIAVVGKPNVGKSTLVNALLGKERMIVSPVPGTTRDSVDSICRYYGKEYLIIDTAGLRRRSRIHYSVERFSVLRALRSIERSDISLLLIDSTEGITEQDQKIASLIEGRGKGVIVIFNKWDLTDDPERDYKRLILQFQRKLRFIDYAGILTVSALSRKRVTKVFPLIESILKERKKRISTPELNEIVKVINPHLPSPSGRKRKILYLTQTGIEPPRFSIFLNSLKGIKPEHHRFIERTIRERYGFKGTPIRINLRDRSGR